MFVYAYKVTDNIPISHHCSSDHFSTLLVANLLTRLHNPGPDISGVSQPLHSVYPPAFCPLQSSSRRQPLLPQFNIRRSPAGLGHRDDGTQPHLPQALLQPPLGPPVLSDAIQCLLVISYKLLGWHLLSCVAANCW